MPLRHREFHRMDNVGWLRAAVLGANDGIVSTAKEIKKSLMRFGWRTVYDDTAGIGKLYRRQDEVGTPWCVTVDFQTLTDRTVTLRDRDTMQQERLAIDDLLAVIRARLLA